MRKHDRNQLPVRAMAWCAAFSIPLVGSGYLAGKWGAQWLALGAVCALFVAAIVARLPR